MVVLVGLGCALIACAALLFGDLVDGFAATATKAFGLLFPAGRRLCRLRRLERPSGGARLLKGLKAALLLLIGFLIIDHPLHSDAVLAWLLGIALILDGLWRPDITLVRYRRWPVSAAIVAAELVLAVLIIAEWPLPHAYNLPLCISLLLLNWGVGALRIGLWLRNEPEEVALYALPAFGGRNWNENAPVLVDSGEREARPRACSPSASGHPSARRT